MLLWVIGGLQATAGAHNACVQQSYTGACQTGVAIGAGLGVTLLAIIWFVGFIVLSLVWLMSRPDRRYCPQCGREVKKGRFVCKACGYDFRASIQSYVVPDTRVS